MTQALTLDATLARGIGCLAEAKTFLSVLHREGKMFHLEDSPEDIINVRTGELIFTPEQCAQVRERVRECYRFNWGDYECPIGYALELINDEER